jgi:CBS domain-containing protein
MQVRDLMSREVVTVGPEASLRDVARIMVDKGISGLPVVDAGEVVGVISEADILYREGGEEPGSRFTGSLAWFEDSRPSGTAVKVRAQTVGEAMTSPAVTVAPWLPIAEAARLMLARGINRLPVVKDEDQLVGIVTRADLVRAFTRTDEEIAAEIKGDLLERALWLDPGAVKVAVDGGHVTLKGTVPRKSDATVIDRLVERMPGVLSVDSSLHWDVDDSKRKRSDHSGLLL